MENLLSVDSLKQLSGGETSVPSIFKNKQNVLPKQVAEEHMYF